jgi:hypothetical protein
MKLTDWYPAHVKPVREGVYERDAADSDGRAFAYWDGNRWFSLHWVGLSDPKTAARAIECARAAVTPSSWPRTAWRGLAEDPNKKGAVA